MTKRLATVGLGLWLAVAPSTVLASGGSGADEGVTGDQGTDMVLDLVVARPLGLATTILGSAAFVLSLPFTVPSGSVGAAACMLVKRPATYTFDRPLGEFDDCRADCAPCDRRDRGQP